MHFTTLAIGTLSAVAGATIIPIQVGQGGPSFAPNDIKAKAGDILEFRFLSVNHSVGTADFANPCKPQAKGGFFSDFHPVSSGEDKTVFQVTVNDTQPIWIYCAQPVFEHCKNGMVGVVNAPADKTLAQFKAAAAKISDVQSPTGGAFGGIFTTAGSNSGSNSTGNSTSTSSPSSTSTGKPPANSNAATALGSVSGLVLAAVGLALLA